MQLRIFIMHVHYYDSIYILISTVQIMYIIINVELPPAANSKYYTGNKEKLEWQLVMDELVNLTNREKDSRG